MTAFDRPAGHMLGATPYRDYVLAAERDDPTWWSYLSDARRAAEFRLGEERRRWSELMSPAHRRRRASLDAYLAAVVHRIAPGAAHG
jgi:hypothetical protein